MSEANNPVLGYAESYRMMVRMADAEGRPRTVEMSSVIADLERNIAPLFTAVQSELATLRGELHHAQCRASAFEAGNRVMEANLAAAKREIDELKVDKARLDFWQKTPEYVGGILANKPQRWSFLLTAGRSSGTGLACYGDTLREALDQLQVMHADLTKHTDSTKRH